MASDLVASSSTTTQQRLYDVFLSFRGEDTRNNFVSHLHKALSDHHIRTFIDYDLNRGEYFPPALLTAIEASSISIIIFSENYANSEWCLKELVKIMDCKTSNGQIVLPVFYGVDPTHVRAQTGTFGDGFGMLQARLNRKMDLERSHLIKAANIAGLDSQIIRPESKLITQIVGGVRTILNQDSFSYSTNLIGIFHHIENVEFLMCLDEPNTTCIVGIWGMGGIGKTTIARAVFSHICGRFNKCYLLLNVHDELKTQSVYSLRDKLLSHILEKDCRKPDFIKRTLERIKVFIVLDDVNDSIQLKELLGGQDYSFGCGSKILVTSRNKQVLKSAIVPDKIYEVEAMSEEDAMTLFSVHAFNQKYPKDSHRELSLRAVNYARGNPLALTVLGSALIDRSIEEWLSALEGLKKELNNDIRKVLMISYSTLSRGEKQMFLDIACLFYGCDQNFINEYYGESGIFNIKTLQDKSLITISSSNTIEMHGLLKDMGQSIDQEEHTDARERLWIPKDACIVLANKKGRAKIKAISLDISGMKEYLDGDAFYGMEYLQYLKLYNNNSNSGCDEHEKKEVCFKGKGGVVYLPRGLRYFQWDGFPAKSLQSNFCAENLVELHLNGSNVEKLWEEEQDLGNLRVISLNGCSNLIKIPNLSKAKNLKRIGLSRCKNVPSEFVSDTLEYLHLSFCLNVKRIPDISSKSIKWLDLSGTDIEEVPSSIESLSRLEELKMNDCRSLSTISTNICKLKFLECFSFKGCVKLETFPEILEPLEHLNYIWLSGCSNLKSLPSNWHNLKSLGRLFLNGTGITEVLPMNDDDHPLSSFVNATPVLYLAGNNLESLPENIDRHLKLHELYVNDSKNLRSIPKLPSSLQTLEANDCESLECIHGIVPTSLMNLSLINCYKLNEEARSQILRHSQSRMMQVGYEPYWCAFPGTEIPAEFIGMGMIVGEGSCVTIQLPSSDQDRPERQGFAFCLLCSPHSNGSFSVIQCVLKDNDQVRKKWLLEPYTRPTESDHLFMGNKLMGSDFNDGLMGKKVSFEFSDNRVSLDVIKCGVLLLVNNNTRPLPTSFISRTAKTGEDRPLISVSASSSLQFPKTPFILRSLLNYFPVLRSFCNY